MPIGILMPVLQESEKARAAKMSSVYKCILVKCDLDSELEDKDIRIKIAYNMVDHSLCPAVKGFCKICPKIN